ncbi:hypothetical protein MMC13_002080 [Lambiella insularis]|nr:hypothetical protein [Lambiella insularis]
MPQVRQPAQKSMKVAAREAMKGDAAPIDLGLLPGTFVMPTGNKLPSILKSTLQRLKLEWHRFKIRVVDFGGWVPPSSPFDYPHRLLRPPKCYILQVGNSQEASSSTETCTQEYREAGAGALYPDVYGFR